METGSTLLNGKAIVEGQSIQAGPPQTGQVVGPDAITLTLQVNGRAMTVVADPGATLVQVLRDTLGLTGTKIGCDRGACSACTVWLDGEVASSCMTLVLDARHRRITTIEGLADGDTLHPVQRAFVEHDAMQCGFCTPGMVMSCAALVERNPDCTLDDVKAAVSGHLCRCGTYPNVFAATLAAARAKKSNTNQAETTTSKERREQ
jgi:carbon-monoxide dehydrogenase small subunit/xanthine dehydrogenase YagT iron-sulfur-binding subunit